MTVGVRVCGEPRCPRLVRDRTRCDEHTRTLDAARGTRQARGYGAAYDRARRRAARQVAHGNVTCWRCHELIAPDADWHLGHDDADRTVINGPEHAYCNLSAAARNRQI